MRKVRLLSACASLYQDGDVVDLYSLEDILKDPLIDDKEKEECKTYNYENVVGFVKGASYEDKYGKREFVHVYSNEIKELDLNEESTDSIQNGFVNKVEIGEVRLNDIVIARSPYWQGLYVNGLLEYQDDRIEANILSEYTPINSIKVINVELSDDAYEFSNRLTDLKCDKN